MGIKFVGDLSIADASVLADVSSDKRVLEFGSGGSTHIFAQTAQSVVSVETEQVWIDRTQENIQLLDDPALVTFVSYRLFNCRSTYDVIFVDGVPDKRQRFAEDTWKFLAPGGVMMFHDTRRFEYFREAAWIMQLHFAEVLTVEVNKDDSNLTLVYKRDRPLQYENWNYTEDKPLWAYGKEPRPAEHGLWEATQCE